MTSEELEQLKAYTKEMSQRTGSKFELDVHRDWVITFVHEGSSNTKANIRELHGGRKLEAHKRAIDKYVMDLEDPASARRRENRYHRGAPDFPTLIV